MAKISKSASTPASNTNTNNGGNKRREIHEIGSLFFGYKRDGEGNILGAEGCFGALESEYKEIFDKILFMNESRSEAKIFASQKHEGLCCYIVREDKKWLKGKIVGNRWQTQSQDFATGEVRTNEIVFFQTNFWSDNPNKDLEHQQLRPGDTLMFAVIK